MGILSWIIFGLIAGAVAKLLMPGNDPGGILMTILLGIAGAVLGGFIASYFGIGGPTTFNPKSFLIAVGGTLLLLFIYRLARGRRN